MKTVLELLRLSTDYLAARGVPSAARAAEEVIGAGLQMPRLNLYLHFEKPVTAEETVRCRELLERRGKREPIQYLVGEVEFYGCPLWVTPAVLIPRPETEQLVDKVAAGLEPTGKVLWDVCCGSGCIGIALKKKFPEMEVVASDISAEALAVARKNAERNGVEIELLQGDLLAPFAGRQCDYVVCNPPYVAAAEYSELQPEVRDHEPRGALVAGDSGLEIYERLAEGLPSLLREGRRAWLEIGTGQGEEVQKLFPDFKSLVECDWAGHQRFFSLEKLV